MTEAERQALQAELADLRRKLAKRGAQGGYATNAAEIEARMAEIQRQLSEGG